VSAGQSDQYSGDDAVPVPGRHDGGGPVLEQCPAAGRGDHRPLAHLPEKGTPCDAGRMFLILWGCRVYDVLVEVLYSHVAVSSPGLRI